MHQVPRLGLFIREFFRYGDVSVEILDKDLEIAIQLEKGEASLVET
jgi:hypothetical protein